MPTNAIQLIAPILLALTALCLWLAPRVWSIFLILTFVTGCIAGQLTWLAALWIGMLAAACCTYSNELRGTAKWMAAPVKTLSFIAIVILAIGLGTHSLPGFHNIQAIAPTRLSSRSIPYEQWINFDKTLAGVLVLGICYRHLITAGSQLWAAVRRAFIPAMVTIVSTVLLSRSLGYVAWDPKWTAQFWLWAPINLLGTCMSEEALFRAFLQTQIQRLLAGRRAGVVIAVACSAVLFGIAHVAGGWRYVALASFAGAGYATVFYRTGRIETSIFTHFAVNTVHFLLFTYPAVASP